MLQGQPLQLHGACEEPETQAEAALSSRPAPGGSMPHCHIPLIPQIMHRRDTEAGGWPTHVNVRATDADPDERGGQQGPRTKQAVTPGPPSTDLASVFPLTASRAPCPSGSKINLRMYKRT